MTLSKHYHRRFSKVIAAGDGATDIIAAPGAGISLVITYCLVIIKTSAAQSFDLADASNTNKTLQVPVSLAVGSRIEFEAKRVGVKLVANEAFRYLPSAAGYAAFITGEYYVEGGQ